MGMQIKDISDKAFSAYGKVITGLDVTGILKEMEHTPLPDDVIYVPSVPELEALPEALVIQNNVYGELPIQIGYCNGHNTKLNAVEYHRNSEINIAVTDLVLIIGKQQDIGADYTYDTSLMEAFLVPAGTVIEVYGTTLHYAPCHVEDGGFRCVVVLPRGTNTDMEPLEIKNEEDELLFARNKWLIGHEEGGQLTEAVRRRPYSVVLLDEVEKAHPEVFDILLQVLDDGRLTDGQGRTVDFRNVILILTSNLGSQYLVNQDLPFDERSEKALEVVHQAFRPEFLNRLDDIIMFQPLSAENLGQIVGLQIKSMAKRLEDRRLTLNVTPAALEWLGKTGYDPAFGARPLRRLVQREIGDRLARGILSGAIHDGDTVTVDVNPDVASDGLSVTSEREQKAEN